ncbi:MAG: tRNA (5-methylaminomethyl-2-thiouridine)(34)-methyltransferase MnmD [Bacteroidota bacterium]|nr:tRNA (5-methylaminomethyl-2-thiouridine)(34)-methyltransferase MnmD [Bacteroidota bacterium]
MKRELQLTFDGSHTIFIPSSGVTYHSKHGAIQESLHVFIEAGLMPVMQHQKEIHVFEMGFGTGLNTLLTLQAATKQQKKVEYTAVELYPLTKEEYEALNYGATLQLQNELEQIHTIPWERMEKINPFFSLYKTQTALQNFHSTQLFDVIYYDAFAPSAQPELWTKDIFSQLFSLLKDNGLLVTYCSKGEVRRAMQAVGFNVSKLPGAPGKREMLKAIKTNKNLL